MTLPNLLCKRLKMIMNLFKKYRNGIIVGTSWGLMMIIAYEFTNHLS